ncbi:MAG: VanW family protein [Candidatus Parcubacteria bacterium]|nr:VanW family protein [Candidatus Parcubacteria bacterium]
MINLKEFFKKILDYKKAEHEKRRKKLIKILTIFFICLFLAIFLSAPIFAYEYIYRDKIFQGVYVDGINLGGLTQDQALDKLNDYIDNLKQNGLRFNYNGNVAKVEFNAISPADPDLSFQILDFDTMAMIKRAYNIGHQGNLPQMFNEQLLALLNQPKIELIYNLNEKVLVEILKQYFSQYEKPAMNAQIVFNPENSYRIEKESDGYIFNYSQSAAELRKNINLISINAVELKTQAASAEVIQAEAEKSRTLIDDILKQENIILTYKDQKWEIPRDEFKNWLEFKKENNELKLTFKDEMINQKLQAISQTINVLPQDAKFTFQDGKVTEFVPSEPGLEVDLEKSKLTLQENFFNLKQNQTELSVKESEPNVKISDINNFGIKELIGKGVSDFAGSHVNRIKNIKNAVAHLNGIIIPPGEFSIVDAIGPVDASTGYFPEFVIKGDRTLPEYGGGLCQIGTTMFRVALYSGLPITERRPHSYIVSYYKPIGMDATIYGPHPDLRFNNDTGNNILLQIKIEGTILTYEFWGTSDGRKVEITEPQLYNWTAQPADRLIENPVLKPGEKKLMEKGRRGADANFYRYITNAAGEKKEEIFRSHYVAWPNIYEVGLQPTPAVTTTPENGTADSTSGASGSSGNQNTNSV